MSIYGTFRRAVGKLDCCIREAIDREVSFLVAKKVENEKNRSNNREDTKTRPLLLFHFRRTEEQTDGFFMCLHVLCSLRLINLKCFWIRF
jgi:hypothetical protein